MKFPSFMPATPINLCTKPQIIIMLSLLILAILPLISFLHWFVTGFIVTMFGLRMIGLQYPQRLPGRWLLVFLTFLGFAIVAISYRSVVGQDAGTALLLVMLALKTLELRTERDLRILALLFNFLLMVEFLFNDAAWLTLYLGVLLIANHALLVAVTLTDSLQQQIRRIVPIVIRLTAQAVPFALLLFLLFPRLDTPLWSLQFHTERGISGVTDELMLGSISELVLSGEVAFHVHFEQPLTIPLQRLYWRGPVLWQTDGQQWQPAPKRLYRTMADPTQIIPRAEHFDYHIIMEPTGQRWLFALDLPLQTPMSVIRTRDFRLLTPAPINELKRYTLHSVLRYQTTGLSAEERQFALQYPEAAITERLRQLVQDWQTQADHDHQAIIEQALDYFRTQNFVYTLFPPLLGDLPVDEFMFESRSGYCEHYASSFGLLMRVAGIPSRLVVGYLGAEYNPLGGHYVVRQSDAHVWTEVWLEERGWVRVDATAAVAPDRVDTDTMASNLGVGVPSRFRQEDAYGLWHGWILFVDALDAGWKNWVVGFSSDRQQQLLTWFGLGHLRAYGLVLGLFCGSMVFLLLLNGWLGRRIRHHDPIVQSYLRLCRRLAWAGWPRRFGEGPQDYLHRVMAAQPTLRQPLTAILELYLALRFGSGHDGHRHRMLQRQVAALSLQSQWIGRVKSLFVPVRS
jgi:transglutaminase-like putative cysteine protease